MLARPSVLPAGKLNPGPAAQAEVVVGVYMPYKMMSLALVVVRLPLVKLLPATLLWATALPSLTEELAAPAISYTTSTAFPTPPEVLNVTVTLVTAAAFAA